VSAASTILSRQVPEPHVCEQARLSRDARFDGLFFTGVVSTRIYCRPVCPARWATRVIYFSTAASAEASGFRPCLRCRPELSPSDGAWRRSDEVVARALKLLDHLDDEPLTVLAAREVLAGLGVTR
jgi:AraC family transcriptional regulator of adaptative response / DNA-3-methyladenine glycosylase II